MQSGASAILRLGTPSTASRLWHRSDLGKIFGSFCLRCLCDLCSLFLSSEGNLLPALQEDFCVQLMLILCKVLEWLGAEAILPCHGRPCCCFVGHTVFSGSAFQQSCHLSNVQVLC